MAEESIYRPFYTVLVLAFFCSALVAGAAVGLRPLKQANQELDRRQHILRAAGLFSPGVDVAEVFENIETRIVDLQSGEYVDESVLSPDDFDQRKAAMTSEYGRSLAADEDIAKLKRVENYSYAYLVRQDGRLDQIVLPVRGKGLWSTMYAYVALESDLSTINGVSFYEHGETPGLGGEIENPAWLEKWAGKSVYGPDGTVALDFAKGQAEATGEAAQYQIDGLTGATLTTDGVENLMEFWFGDHGFKSYLEHLRNKESNNG